MDFALQLRAKKHANYLSNMKKKTTFANYFLKLKIKRRNNRLIIDFNE